MRLTFKPSGPQALKTLSLFVILRRVDILERAGVFHFHIHDPIAVSREHGLRADVRIRRAQIRKHRLDRRSPGGHDAAACPSEVEASAGRTIGARVRRHARDHRGHRRRRHQRHVHERDQHRFEQRRRRSHRVPRAATTIVPAATRDARSTRARGSCARHRVPHRVDVRAGHDDDAGTPPANSVLTTRDKTVSPVCPSGSAAFACPIRDEAPAARTMP